ncbi:MAG: hypothetical protein LBB65_02260 [Burkholderiales bacterium]|nr:hypothetical protein [Burkholderiales bacterium]
MRITKTNPTRQYTGQWASANEDAWGMSVIMGFPNNAKYIFVPWYTYDSNGKAAWYIFQGDGWSANDKITLDVYRYTGPNWGTAWNNSKVANTKVGTATLTFTSATAVTFQYNVDNANRTVSLAKLQ